MMLSGNDSEKFVPWILGAILVLALLLRLPGHFYPVPFHYDEGSDLQEALRYFSGRLHPDNLRHPLLNSYLVFIAEASYYVGGRATGVFGSLREFLETYLTNRSGYLYAGRTISLLAGLLTIFLTYRLGRRIWGVLVGLGAALFLAVSPLHIIISNNLHIWSLGTCFAVLALLLIIQLGPATERRQVAVAGIIIGFAIASVYSLVLLVLPLMVALYIRWRDTDPAGSKTRQIMDLLTIGASMALGFAVGNFGALLAWKKVLRAVGLMVGEYGSGSATDYLISVERYIVSISDEFALGPLIAGLAGVGVLREICQRLPRRWVVLSFVAGVFLIQPALLGLAFYGSRYTIVTYPVLLLVASALVIQACTWLAAARPWLRWSPVLALLLVAVPNLLTVVEYHNAVRRTSTRELARQWVEANLPAGTTVVVGLKHMSPVLPLGGTSLERELRILGYRTGTLADKGPRYEVIYLQPHNIEAEKRESTIRNRIAELAVEGAYLIHTDPRPPRDKAWLGAKDFFRDWLDSRYLLVSRFLHADLTRLPDETATVNPEVRIYRLLRDSSIRPTQW